MESISLFALFEKHIENFKIYQVCQFVSIENDTVYEFLYDGTFNKVILDVIRNRSSKTDYIRDTYQFEDKNITIYDALTLYGRMSPQISIDTMYDQEIMHGGVYMSLPINGLPLAQGTIKFESC